MPEPTPPPTHSVSRLLNRIRTRGLGEVVQLASNRLRDAISSSDTLLVFSRPAGGAADPPEGLRFRPATPADAARYAEDIGTDSVATFTARLSKDMHCFLVLQDQLIVHSSWVTTSGAWTREIRGFMRPPARSAYVFESFTRPEVRGRGVYPFTLRAICGWAKGEGLERVWVAVEADNPASIRAVTKAGFQEAFRFSYRRSLGRLWIGPPRGEMAQIGTSFVSRTR